MKRDQDFEGPSCFSFLARALALLDYESRSNSYNGLLTEAFLASLDVENESFTKYYGIDTSRVIELCPSGIDAICADTAICAVYDDCGT